MEASASGDQRPRKGSIIINIKLIYLTAEVRRTTAGQTALLEWGSAAALSLITRAFPHLWLRGPEISFCHTMDHYKISLYYKALHCTIFRPRTQDSVTVGSSHYY
jgi:hypothetical protein